MTSFEIFELGDHALVATAVNAVSFETQQRIWRIADLVRGWPEVEEAIPGMNNITLIFDPLKTDLDALRAALERVCMPFGDEADGRVSVADPGTGTDTERDSNVDSNSAADVDADAPVDANAYAEASLQPGATVRPGAHTRPEAHARPDADIEHAVGADVATAGRRVRASAKTASRHAAHAPDRRAQGRLVELPVQYGGAEGPDIEGVARHVGLSVEALIERHAAIEYTVYFLGFQPGFAYLGGLDPALATPRRKEPRLHVPAGSVGIGGEQTGVYPTASPGGWQLIGRTAEVLFDPNRDPPSLLEPGDRVRFVPIGGTT